MRERALESLRPVAPLLRIDGTLSLVSNVEELGIAVANNRSTAILLLPFLSWHESIALE